MNDAHHVGLLDWMQRHRIARKSMLPQLLQLAIGEHGLREIIKEMPLQLVAPRALTSNATTNAPTHFDVLVIRDDRPFHALVDVRTKSLEKSATIEDARTAHAVDLAGFQFQASSILLATETRLAHVDGIAAVDRVEKGDESVRTHVEIVVGAHEPIVVVDEMIVNVFEHCENFFLGRIRVVDGRKCDDRQVGARRAFRREEGDFRHFATPRFVDRSRARFEEILRRDHAHEKSFSSSELLG